MPTRESRLIAFANIGAQWAPCGQLVLTEEGSNLIASSFAYGLNYLKRNDALEVDPVSLSIADRTSISGKYLLPANALNFFGGIRDAAPDSWGRRVIEAKLKAPPNSLAESEYLLHAGSDRVGALDIRRSRTDLPTAGVSNWHSLSHLMEAAQRIEDGLPIPAHLEAIYVEGTALGGARPKASVRDEQGVLWLAKFASRHDRFDIPGIEYAALRMAEKAGLRVPPVKTLMLGKRRIMLIRRFDRYWMVPGGSPAPHADLVKPGSGDGRVEHRSGFVSGLTLLACDETESRDKSYADLADAIRRHCHPGVIRDDNAELFKRMVYNIFVSNDDDHLRNHGFIWDAALPGWRLSPLYDVLPRASNATERYLHLSIGDDGRLATLDNALGSHDKFTLSRRAASQLIADIWRVVREWRVYFEEFGIDAAEMDKAAPAFRHIDDISTPELRKLLP
ncbi:MAG: type II toxin-antitoxin system HipA family toxin [Paraburkholderia sp.]|uniref:type II toxin-antitoxin system HipA family toxin n=1 Tax=Paraburkholderia sp. TaxID=1926495 RepID=UPI0012267E03|nr:HipA domain-containing protein [Paraburkholderia sp.]TAL96348.1 MAG: type II toxin-antitoxin system HipA family toxin [Paraburkholderia sp.]